MHASFCIASGKSSIKKYDLHNTQFCFYFVDLLFTDTHQASGVAYKSSAPPPSGGSAPPPSMGYAQPEQVKCLYKPH